MSKRKTHIQKLQAGLETGTVSAERFGKQIARASQRGQPSRIRAKMRRLTENYNAGLLSAIQFAECYAAQKAKLDAIT